MSLSSASSLTGVVCWQLTSHSSNMRVRKAYSSSEGQKINHQQHAQRVVLWIKASEGSEHNKRNQNKRHKS